MPGDLREDLASTLAELEQGSGTGAPAPEPSPSPAPEPSPSPSPEGRQRDEHGRFARKEDEEQGDNTLLEDKEPRQEAAAPQQKPEVTTPQAPVPPAPSPQDRAPVSWRPEARETWASLAPQAKAEIQRREAEVTQTLNRTAEARRFHEEFERVTRPYEHFFRAEGSDALKATEYLMQTAAALRTAPPQQKATMVADMIMQFGIDLNMLDTVLSHKVKGMPPPNDPMAALITKELQPIKEFMSSIQQVQQTQKSAAQQAAQDEIDAFMADEKNEFAQDVWEDMADLIELAANRGRKMSLQDAYQRAIVAHPTISKIVESRKTGQSPAQRNAAALRAKNAAASISTEGGTPPRGEEDEGQGDLRSDLMSAFRSHQNPVR